MATSLGLNDTGKVSLGNTLIFSKISIGNEIVYSAGNTVTYYVDTNAVYQEEVDADETVLSPKTFTPTKAGWEFVGWRKDTVASGDVLSSLTMDNDPITLYAVYQQGITLSYYANGGSGITESQTETRYYNNENVTNALFTLSKNSFNKSGYNFSKWAMGSADGTQYDVGASVTLSENTVFYAVWTYVGSPFYVVDKSAAQQALTWTVIAASNTTYSVGGQVKWTKGQSNVSINSGYLSNGTQPSTTWRSDAISTNGNKNVSITIPYAIGSADITINGVTKYLTDATKTQTWNVSNVTNFTMTVRVSNVAYSGNGYFEPSTIRVY